LTYSDAESLDSNDENGKKLKQLYYPNPNPNPNHLPQMFPILVGIGYTYKVAHKIGTVFIRLITSILTNFQTLFTVKIRKKFVIAQYIPPHLNVTLHYLVKCRCLKTTIENKTSVTTRLRN